MNRMKGKWFPRLLMACACALICTAGFAADYKVMSVTGKVTYQEKSGGWTPVAKGSMIDDSTQINVGLNSKLVILIDKKEVTIEQMKRGALWKLLGKSGPEISSTKSKREVEGEVSGSRKAVQTAASRAADMDDDDDWEDDDEWEYEDD